MMERKRNKKIIRALLRVILGFAVMCIVVIFILYMYFSGTFLPNRHLERYILYGISFFVVLLSYGFVDGALQYLGNVIKRKVKGRRH